MWGSSQRLTVLMLSCLHRDVVVCHLVEQAQLLEVCLPESSCIVSDGYHRTHASLPKDILDSIREENPGQALTGTMVTIRKACFEIRPEKVTLYPLHYWLAILHLHLI